MPYIPQHTRIQLANGHGPAANAGQLNYLFSQIVRAYVQEHGEGYPVFNDCIGALECCKMEVYRRLVVAYEERKRAENGEVF